MFFLVAFALLFLQFFKIQVLEGNLWQLLAEQQHYFVVETPAKRGTIYSSSRFGNPLPLSLDVEVFDLYGDPKVIPKEKREEIVLSLAELLHLNEGDIDAIRLHLGKKSRRRKLLSWIEEDEKKKILAWWTPYAKAQKLSKNGLFLESNFKRIHPSDPILGQVLHTVRHLRDEKSRRAEPTGGLELVYDSELQGKGGKKKYLRSPLNTFDIGETISLPEKGGGSLSDHPPCFASDRRRRD